MRDLPAHFATFLHNQIGAAAAHAGQSSRHRLHGFPRDDKAAIAPVTAVAVIVTLGFDAFAIATCSR